MEPISLIISALTAGAIAAAKDMAEKGGKYNINISGGTQGVVGENKGTVNRGK